MSPKFISMNKCIIFEIIFAKITNLAQIKFEFNLIKLFHFLNISNSIRRRHSHLYYHFHSPYFLKGTKFSSQIKRLLELKVW